MGQTTLGGIKPIYLCSFYRPPDGLKDPILRLTAALNKLYDKSSQPPNIILAGDFNFPNLLWEGGIGSVDPNPTYGPEANHLFIETTKDYGLEQLVSQPTRGNHILDLALITTHPDMLHDLEIVPGISDHEAITFQLNLDVIKLPSNNLHKVYQYHKANTTEIINKIDEFSNIF